MAAAAAAATTSTRAAAASVRIPSTVLAASRWHRSGLLHSVSQYTSAEEVAAGLIGVQGQIIASSAISTWNRLAKRDAFKQSEYRAKLMDTKSLVVTWSFRVTLHVHTIDDWQLVVGASSDKIHAGRSMGEAAMVRAKIDVGKYRALAVKAREIMAADGFVTRPALEQLSGHPTDARMLSRYVMYDATFQGDAVFSGVHGSRKSTKFSLREDWLPDDTVWKPPTCADEANADLLRRYLHVYGPATLMDFAFWRGCTKTDAKPWLEMVKGEVTRVTIVDEDNDDDDGGSTKQKPLQSALLALTSDVEHLKTLGTTMPKATQWPTRLLYRFDPLVLALRDKSWLVDMRFYKKVWGVAAQVHAVLVHRGRAVGTWVYDHSSRGNKPINGPWASNNLPHTSKPGGLRVQLRPFWPLPKHVTDAAQREAHGLAKFMEQSLELFEVLEPVATKPDPVWQARANSTPTAASAATSSGGGGAGGGAGARADATATASLPRRPRKRTTRPRATSSSSSSSSANAASSRGTTTKKQRTSSRAERYKRRQARQPDA